MGTASPARLRRADWVARLYREVEIQKGEAFAYGKNDCCSFVARCIDAMTGDNLAEMLTHCYHDARSAKRFLRAEGGMELAVSSFLGDSVPGHNARRGDACLVEVEDGPGVGICLGPTIAVRHDGELIYYPLKAAHAHWSV